MEQIINSYYENNAKKLRNTVNQIFYRKYGGISEKDMDEFYSVANDVFADIVKNNRYDAARGDFEGFLYGALSLAIVDEFKRQNRDKRTNKIYLLDENGDTVLDENGRPKRIPIPDVYIDTPLGNSDGATIGDLIQSDFDMETVLSKYTEEFSDQKIERYLNHLPKIQRNILELKMRNIPISVIKKKLQLSDSQYNKHCQEIRSFENINILYGIENCPDHKEENKIMNATQTMENCKTDRISIASIIKKIDKHTIRFDHPLQRESGQWSPAMKGNLVSDILQGNKLHPLIFAEQIINGVAIIWDLDGKQRCTNAYDYSKNAYKISKNIRRWMIKYQTTEKDENGNDVLDENGFPIAINAEFDIRGKGFSDLPEELRDRFLDYSFNYDQYLNCSEEDIGYHIERYNDGKPMTISQKGVTKLGTKCAEMVKSISNMPFFKDMGTGYKLSEFKNGTINRVVVESIMASSYLNEWKKDQDYLCRFLRDNATQNTFDNFEDMVERLERVLTDDVAEMFDSKDSFLWFGLFAKFINTGEDDRKFIDFLAEFSKSLHGKIVNGKTFDELSFDKKTGKTRSTKDKYIVDDKMQLLEILMMEFLGLDLDVDVIKNENVEEFIAENLDMDIDDVRKDIDLYNESLEDLLCSTIKYGSKLLDQENRKSMIAMVAFSFREDIDLEEWLTEYAKNNNAYLKNQKENFIHMKEDLMHYIIKKEKKGA